MRRERSIRRMRLARQPVRAARRRGPRECRVDIAGEIAWVTRDPHNGRIDLVERELLSGHAVTGERASPQADDGDTRDILHWERGKHLADRPGTIVIGEWFLSPCGLAALRTMLGGAAEEQGQSLCRIDANV